MGSVLIRAPFVCYRLGVQAAIAAAALIASAFLIAPGVAEKRGAGAGWGTSKAGEMVVRAAICG